MSELFAEKYSLLSRLGDGGMCDVFKARQLLFDRMVAVKILRATIARSEESKARFIREAKNCAHLDHANIVPIYDVSEHKNRPYIVMQLMEGGSLKDLLKEKTSLYRIIQIITQVTKALSFAHESNIIHRDLKPENILLSSDGLAKVADWGLAKTLDGSQNLTNAGVVLGTPEYMSPEQIMSQPLSTKSDLYSLGVMLFETLSGRLPFISDTITDLLQAHIHHKPERISKLISNMPPELDNLIAQLLEKDAENRPASAGQVAEDLEDILRDYSEELENMHFGENNTEENKQQQGKSRDKRATTKNISGNNRDKSGRPTMKILDRKTLIYVFLVAAIVIISLLWWRGFI